ncbi:MAG TPA: HD domain-containing protein [Smithella sp.]|nr:HD domain-containing protein [Smithella sp.]
MENTKRILSQRFEDALVYAAKLHKRQARDGSGVPYIAHLLGVASIALEYGADEDEAIAALLHDAIEDQGGDMIRQEIRKHFGDQVVEIVNGCTDSDVIPKPPWKERKDAYIAHIRNATPSVRLVSAADKLHNLQTIVKDYRIVGDEIWNRFKGGKEGTFWYYRSLITEFRAAEGSRSELVEELARVFKELERVERGNK